MEDVVAKIMEENEKKRALYSAFTEKMEKLIRDLIKENNLRVHSVTSRVKTKVSLQRKLAQSEKKYSKLSNVPDISGLRIITYFADDVDLVARMIDKEFDVDKRQSVNKSELLDPDRFGYLSLHYVVKFSTPRLKLTEYKRFADFQAEIQIRSILQHAWAEIEHDLGYKGKHAVPKEIRRRFSRLAGLLEIADDEFAQIRKSFLEYEQKVSKQIFEAPAEVLINKASVLSFVRTSSLVHELDKRIASVAESRIVEDEEYINRTAEEIGYVGLKTIAELDSSLHEMGEIAVRFAELWITPSKYEELSAGICLAYLVYALIGSKKSIDKAYDYLEAFEIGGHDKWNSLAKKIISIYSKVANG